MMSKPFRYVPILKWKLGEYQALSKLSLETKAHITPLIEIPPVGWDFELEKEAKSIDEHLEPFGRRLKVKWQDFPSFVDLNLIDSDIRMQDGLHPISYVFKQARENKACAIPVTNINCDTAYQDAVANVITEDLRGVCVRLAFDDLSESDFPDALIGLMNRLNIKAQDVDLCIDLGSPSFEPIDKLAALLWQLIQQLPHLSEWRSLVIAGASFPESMTQIREPFQILTRYEWQLYKKLIATTPPRVRVPNFGDYAIAHPNLPQGDMRRIKPSASIRYAVDDAWYVAKGPNVRDHGYEQYRQHCHSLINSGYFAGRNFSTGDQYIEDCGTGKGKTGNLPTWRYVGTNHHLTKVIRDAASLHAI